MTWEWKGTVQGEGVRLVSPPALRCTRCGSPEVVSLGTWPGTQLTFECEACGFAFTPQEAITK